MDYKRKGQQQLIEHWILLEQQGFRDKSLPDEANLSWLEAALSHGHFVVVTCTNMWGLQMFHHGFSFLMLHYSYIPETTKTVLLSAQLVV